MNCFLVMLFFSSHFVFPIYFLFDFHNWKTIIKAYNETSFLGCIVLLSKPWMIAGIEVTSF